MAEDKLEEDYPYDIFRQVASSRGDIPGELVLYKVKVDAVSVMVGYDLAKKEFVLNEERIREIKPGKLILHAIKNDLAVVQMQKDLAKLQQFNEEQEREKRRQQ